MTNDKVVEEIGERFNEMMKIINPYPNRNPSHNKQNYIKSAQYKDLLLRMENLKMDVMKLLESKENVTYSENVDKRTLRNWIYLSIDKEIINYFKNSSLIKKSIEISGTQLNPSFKGYLSNLEEMRKETTLSVASFNMENKGYSAAEKLMKDDICLHFFKQILVPFDIVAVQEITYGGLEIIREKLTQFDENIELYHNEQNEGFLFKSNRFKEVRYIEELSGIGLTSKTGHCTIKVETHQGLSFHLISIHLTPKNEGIDHFKLMINSLKEKKIDLWMIIGDYNFDYDRKGFEKLFQEGNYCHSPLSNEKYTTPTSEKVYDITVISQPLADKLLADKLQSKSDQNYGVINIPEKDRILFKSQGGILSNHFPIYAYFPGMMTPLEKESESDEYVPEESESDEYVPEESPEFEES